MKAYTSTIGVIRAIAILVFGYASSAASALGLGELEHSNYLGQPLQARIDIVGDDAPTEANLLIRQLNEVEAAALGIHLVSSSYRVRFEPELHDGRLSAINVFSDKVINEPYISLLVELKWPGGLVFREYALLFDAPPVRAQPTASRRESAKPSRPSPAQNPAGTRVAQRPVLPSLSLGSHYLVQSGDTLSGIVAKLDNTVGLSEGELANVIFQANPRAFLRSDMHALKAGARLNIPDQTAVFAKLEPEQGDVSPRVSPSEIASPEPYVSDATAGDASSARQLAERSGRLSLSDGREVADAGADYDVPQIQEQIDGTQEMIDMLVRENQELRERIDKIETSEYLTTLSELVAMQRKQIEALKEEFRAQANAGSASAIRVDQNGTSVSAPVPTVSSDALPPELSFSQKLAQNFWSFISLLILAFLALMALGFYALRKWTENQQAQTAYTQYRDSIESSVDLDSFIGIQESAELSSESASTKGQPSFGAAIDSRRQRPLQERLHTSAQDEKRKRDDEVKERIRAKTSEYTAKPTGLPDTSVNFQVGIDEVIGLDEEVNELLSMAKIYCSAGKYSEARAILSAQHKEDADPRLIDALEQIDKLERS